MENIRDSVIFVNHAFDFNRSADTFTRKNLGNDIPNYRILFILSKNSDFYENMPKTAIITTKNTTLHFNRQMLENTSPVISKFYKDNPNSTEYFINFTDDENVLSKFEQLYQGKDVFFKEEDIPIIQRFTQILQIKNCPNFLKPINLYTDETDSEGNGLPSPDQNGVKCFLDLGVEILEKDFINFLKRNDHQVFKIITNKKEYECNIFAVYTSKVIHQILEKDPNTKEFVYNFEDKNDEFQLICDFFNYKKIDMKYINIDSLKLMAEDLQIDCILKIIDNYYNHCEKISKIIQKHQNIIDSINELFDLLYNIKKYGIEKVKISIVQSKWSQTEENVEELAAFILQVIKPSYSLQKEIAELLIELDKESNDQNKLNILIPFIIERLITLYWPKKSQNINDQKKPKSYSIQKRINVYKTQEKINLTNRCVYSFIRILYKRGLIRKEEIFERLKDYDLSSNLINAFFLPELVEIDPKNFEHIINIDKKNVRYSLGKIDELKFDIKNYGFCYFLPKVAKQYFPDKIDLYAEMLDKMESDDEISKSIHIDDVDTLQNLIFRNKIDTNNYRVSYNIFDDFEEELNLINYTAFCGSVKCFKYLLLNNNEICDTTFYYAVYGGNNEIIKIVNQQFKKKENQDIDYSTIYYDFDLTPISISFWFNSINNNKLNDKKRNLQFGSFSDRLIDKYHFNIIQYNINSKCNEMIFMPNCCNINNIIAPTIVMHKNDIFDQTLENKFLYKGKYANYFKNIAILSASSGNVHALISMFDNYFTFSKMIISFAAKNGFYSLTKILLDLYDVQNSDPLNISDFFYPNAIVHFGNLSIFELFIDKINQFDFTNAFLMAIKMNYTSIVNYVFDNIDKYDFLKYDDDFVGISLICSLTNASMFDFIFEKLEKLRPELFNLNLFTNLLNRACLYSNLTATEKITDIILKENPKYDFTKAFINASSSKSTNICQYLIDKKVQIDFTRSETISNLGKLDIELFEKIINNVDPNLKFMFYDSIHVAIQNKNIQVIEFILKENPLKGFELFEAIQTNDIEVVDVILKYNSQPSFINRMMNNGTALCHAVETRNIEIIKRLLSVPGIDPSKTNGSNRDILIMAIRTLDIEVLDTILNFYDNWDSQFQFSLYFYDHYRFTLLRSKYINDNEWAIILRLAKVKSFDINIVIESHTILNIACLSNRVDIVRDLLKIDNIDVNVYDERACGNPLLLSFELKNIEMAKLIINHPKTNVNIINSLKESALVIAVKYDQQELVELILNDKRFDAEESRLNYAFIFSKYGISKRLYSLSCLDVNQSYYIFKNDHESKINALKHSIKINDVDKIDLIIKHPSFNIYKSNVRQCIFISAKRNNIEIFRKLIKLINNDVDIHNDRGMSLLSYAAINLSGEIVDEILNNEHFDSKDPELILNAFASSYSKIIDAKHHPQNQRLFRPNPLRFDSEQNVFHIYDMNNDVLNQELIPDKIPMIEMMEKLINYDNEHEHLIKFDKLLPNGESFFTTIVNDYPDIDTICDFLIEHGVDPNMSNSNGIYPLEHAIRINSVKLVTSLVNSEKINYSQLRNGFTYLHLAAKNKDSSILSFLLQKNIIDINSINFIGETPLMEACKSKRIDNIKLLFKNDNIDYLHCNKNGEDALDIMASLPPDEKKVVKQSKEKFQSRLISIIEETINPNE